MGIVDFLLGTPNAEPKPVDVQAGAYLPVESPSFAYTPYLGATRSEAMAIPVIARARNIICSTLAGLPLEQYNKFTGAGIEPNRVVNQPDPRVPGSVIYAWIAEDLLFTGVAYGQVLELYGDGRIASWTRISPMRITPQYDNFQTEIIGYLVDGKPVPISGVGSIIAFFGLDEGLLARAGATIRAAAALEKAAENFATNPVPQMALKSNGTNITKERISSLLAAWNTSRKTNSTAFLNADIDLQVLGIDPDRMQLTQARQYVALELCRAIGLPAYFASAETTSMTYSNAISERRALIDFSLRNLMIPIEQRLSMSDFISSTTQEIRFSVDDFLRGNPLERAQVYQILTGIGAMTADEVRKEEDLVKDV